MNPPNQTRVGVGIMIFKEGKILLGKRLASHGTGEYAFPGGHLEYMETFEECARREIAEECGIEVQNVRFMMVGNIKIWTPKHYVHIQLAADWKSGEPQTLEPEKCSGWDWYDLDQLPSPLFRTAQLAIDAFKSGQNYFDNVV